ncbi:MAG: hypothetical protein R2784_09765 [Saprospiraceae bacterium]
MVPEILNNEDVGNVTSYNPADFTHDTTIYVKVIPYNGTGEAFNCDVSSTSEPSLHLPIVQI